MKYLRKPFALDWKQKLKEYIYLYNNLSSSTNSCRSEFLTNWEFINKTLFRLKLIFTKAISKSYTDNGGIWGNNIKKGYTLRYFDPADTWSKDIIDIEKLRNEASTVVRIIIEAFQMLNDLEADNTGRVLEHVFEDVDTYLYMIKYLKHLLIDLHKGV